MTVTYHVNKETGEYGICKATVQQCPVGSVEMHTQDKEQAIYMSEVVLADMYGITETVKKKRTADQIQPRIRHDYPYPEAHKLEKVDKTLYSLRNGAVPPAGLTSAIGVKANRVADFYGEAASFLGLAEAVKDKNGNKAFTLTQDGADYLEQDTAGRQQILRRAIQNIDILDADDETSLDRISSTHGESRDTATRKLSSLRAWKRQIAQDSFLEDVDTRVIDAEVRDDLEQFERTRKDEPVQPEERYGAVCPECFTQMPLTGGCANCDDDD